MNATAQQLAPAQQAVALRRAAAVLSAHDDLIEFVQLLFEDPKYPDDPLWTRYEAAAHHRFMADELQKVESGETKRLVISLPPRHGKTALASQAFPAWFAGRNPHKSVMLATYNDLFSMDQGRKVRDYIQHRAFQQVFPGVKLHSSIKGAGHLRTSSGGDIFAVGRGGAVTGRGGHILIADDLIKDRKEANSPTIRNSTWEWFTQVFMTRLMDSDSCLVLIGTRWHDDDPIGRLTDKRNAHYSPKLAREFRVIDIPALARAGDPLGRRQGQALWPTRFPKQYLRSIQTADPVGFSALYQGRPAPDTGAFFKREHVSEYTPDMYPGDNALRWYLGSDMAVTTNTANDKSVLMLAGMDDNGMLWIHPRLLWARCQTDYFVTQALATVRDMNPVLWFGEKGHISHSIGPFLRKQMLAEQTFVAIREMAPSVDKQTRAQSVAGRMQVGGVLFPAHAPWWPDAKHELLTFPYGSNDDFVDALSIIGLGLDSMHGAKLPPPVKKDPAEQIGTLAWVKANSDRRRREEASRRRTRGW